MFRDVAIVVFAHIPRSRRRTIVSFNIFPVRFIWKLQLSL